MRLTKSVDKTNMSSSSNFWGGKKFCKGKNFGGNFFEVNLLGGKKL